ncbi:MAG: endolytic transglycosylase MltG [Alphaproteobacteria bacterium]|nr:MAG: endolytic transglycosylase MltG [Alphaproteobacteria bacterium]
MLGVPMATLLCLGLAVFGLDYLHHMPGPVPGGSLDKGKAVLIPSGTPTLRIGQILAQEGVIEWPWLFVMASHWPLQSPPLKAGEYLIPSRASVAQIVAQLRGGRTVMHSLTVPEGLTSAQIVALVRAEPLLAGTIPAVPPEGTLLPDTYGFSRGDSREGMIARMTSAMRRAVTELWSARVAGLPYRSMDEAVVMASIVEKETGLAAERRRIAGVFVNRLKRGMRLQADPTVIYGLTQGEGALGRPLTRADWLHNSPYNTYVIDGLPPRPIANPGRAALEAALDPMPHDDLYFVATGQGGHAFARTLEDHNEHVTKAARDLTKTRN